jgi:hypothetical protein
MSSVFGVSSMPLIYAGMELDQEAKYASISNDELRSHYRKLVAENHTDKLMARGFPNEFVAIATEKIAAINGAYGEIARTRGILVSKENDFLVDSFGQCTTSNRATSSHTTGT